MKNRNFKEFKAWFEKEIADIPNNKVLYDIIINLEVFGPKKHIVDEVEFSIKSKYSINIIKDVYSKAIENDQKLIEIYIDKLKTGSYKDYEIAVGCLIGFVNCIYSNYFILEVADE